MARPPRTIGRSLSQLRQKLEEIGRQREGSTVVIYFHYGGRCPSEGDQDLARHDRLKQMEFDNELPPGQRLIEDQTVLLRILNLSRDNGRLIPEILISGRGVLRLSGDRTAKLLRPANYSVEVDGVEIGPFPGGTEFLYQPILDEQIQTWLAAAKAG